VPIVDAGLRELWHTGYMHNRVRMIVASYLCKHLRAHWLHGARWFWDTLVDADLANNTMGWQWVAGTGADAAPYFRCSTRSPRPRSSIRRPATSAAGCPNWRRCR
jgi:deoxyribodipyrimidine photo-lyase